MENLSLCKWLPFFLPINGLIVSAIIGKADGVRAGLVGLSLRWLITVLIVLMECCGK